MVLKRTYNAADSKGYSKRLDVQLLDAYRTSGDRNAIDILFNRYLHLMYGVCLKYLKQPEKAEDATMEILAKLVDDLKIHAIDNFPGWLYRVCKNYCLMASRKKDPLLFSSPIDNRPLNNVLFMEFDRELHLDHKEQDVYDVLQNALNRLKEEQQQCLRLFYLENQSYSQIAEITGMHMKQVKSHIQNGKRNLRNELIKNGKISR